MIAVFMTIWVLMLAGMLLNWLYRFITKKPVTREFKRNFGAAAVLYLIIMPAMSLLHAPGFH
jgi:hypothetical protein